MGPDSPVVNVGDKIKVHWPNDDGSTERITAIVISVEVCKKVKQNSQYKYTIRVQNIDEEVDRSTRLLHLDWKKVSKKQKRNDSIASILEVGDDENVPSKKKRKDSMSTKKEVIVDANTRKSSSVLPAHSRIVAPMVGGSELAFRLLCRYLLRLEVTEERNENLLTSKLTHLHSSYVYIPLH